ncbi:hypothetical protein [Aquimarina pacifica]|uniref:hypothetical protein n=1 Tax=Aquimarina pacifica TaxID=1296415 RepID=UPI00046FE406|nr:hypothetical protein [Aquimarina pacifica]
MIYKFTHFFSFSYPVIVDVECLKRIEFFELDGFKFKLHPPYRTYPYNYDFTPLPLNYKLPSGKEINLGECDRAAIYPVFNKAEGTILGYTLQKRHSYELKDHGKISFPNMKYPDKLPKYYPMDTIRIDADDDFDKYSPRFTQDFINHLRVFSGQWWLGQSNLSANGFNIKGELNNTGYIFNSQYLTPLYPIMRGDKGKPIDSDIWNKSINALINKEDPDVVITLILNARFHSSRNDFRNVVLDLSHALDISFNKLCLDYWVSQGRKEDKFERYLFVKYYRKDKKGKIYYTHIPNLLDEFIFEVFQRSYKKEYPKEHKLLISFWNERRNPISHGKSIKIVEAREALELVELIEVTVEWINSLSCNLPTLPRASH